MNPSIYVVSADPEMGPRLVALLLESRTGAPILLRTGSECLRTLEQAMGTSDPIVVIDGVQTDLAPLNLAGAVRSRRPDANVVLSISSADEQAVRRAMLVGAKAVIERTRVEEELLPTLLRVSLASPVKVHTGCGEARENTAKGASVVVAGASGGAGRSTISTLLAWASSKQGTDTALVDFDLQFGDLAFLHDTSAQPNMVDFVTELSASTFEARRYGRQVRENLCLYSPSPQPEQAELVAPKIRQVLQELRSQHELVVVNTGAFWSLFHAELLDSADLCLFVLRQTAAGIRATVQGKELCHKLGIPDARIAYLMNRVMPRRIITPADAASALGVSEVLSLPDGGHEVSTLLDAGDVEGLYDARNALLPAVDVLLAGLRPIVGLPAPEKAMRPPRRWLLGR